jgi:hypothetical protein
MSNLQDREKAFETKYALDQEVMFRIEARASKLFGLWIAEQAGMDAEAAKTYAGSIVSANLDEPGFDDVKRAVAPVIAEKGLGLNEAAIDAKLMECMEQARLQIMAERNT